MFHFFGRIEDKRGNALPGWYAECVENSDLSTVVPIFADESSTPIITVSGVANRAKADDNGNFDFFVPDGNYGIKYYDANVTYAGKTQRYIPMYGSDAAIAATATATAAALSAAASAEAAYASAVAAAEGVTPGVASSVARSFPRPRRYTAATGMNNPLGVWVDCDGKTFAFNKRPYDLADWTTTVAPVKHVYVSWATGNDANDGSTIALAVKSFHQAMTLLVDKTVFHFLDQRVGFNGWFTGNPAFGTGGAAKRAKLIGEHTGGPTVFTGWSESYNLAHLAFVADGLAYKSTAAINGATLQAMLDDNYRDRYGIPLNMAPVADLATVKNTPGSWNWDGTTFSVRMIDDRVPDPANGLLPVVSFSNFQVTTDADLTIENCSFAYNGGAAASAALRVRPATTGVQNAQKLALKGVRAFGSSGNAFELYDFKIIAKQESYGAYCYYDIHNYSSFISTGTEARWVTIYEDNCFGHNAGYAGRQNPTASNSNNLSTTHRGMHSFRVNTGGYNIPNSWIADVQGGFPMIFGASPTQSTSGGLFQNNYWYQKLSGEGSAGSKMVLIGCNGDANSAGKYHFSNWNDGETAASFGEIHIADWAGPGAAKYRAGTLLFNYDTGIAL